MDSNEFDFGKALDLLGRGTKVTRVGWDEGRVLALEEEKLTEELVSDDILATDWVVVEDASGEEEKKDGSGEVAGGTETSAE